MKQKRAYSRNKYAAGKPVYNGSTTAPQRGPGLDPLGYADRDRRARVRRNAVLRRMKAQNTKNFNYPDWLRDKG